MGGLIGLLYAHTHPEQLQGLINVEGDLDPKDNKLSGAVTAPLKQTFINENIFNFLQQRLAKSKNNGFYQYAKLMHRAADPYAYYDYSRAIREYCQDNTGHQLLQNKNNLINSFIEIQNLKRIPTIYIHGDETNFSSINNASQKVSPMDILKGFKIQVAKIGSSNHFPMYDNPEDFYNTIIKFIKKVHQESSDQHQLPHK